MTARMTVITAGELFMIMAVNGKAVVMRADQDGQCTDVTTEYLRGRLRRNSDGSIRGPGYQGESNTPLLDHALELRQLDKGKDHER